MKIEITEEQRDQLHAVLTTHRHNMHTAALNARGKDQKEFQFYWERFESTKALIPLFAPPVAPPDEDEEEEEAD